MYIYQPLAKQPHLHCPAMELEGQQTTTLYDFLQHCTFAMPVNILLWPPRSCFYRKNAVSSFTLTSSLAQRGVLFWVPHFFPSILIYAGVFLLLLLLLLKTQWFSYFFLCMWWTYRHNSKITCILVLPEHRAEFGVNVHIKVAQEQMRALWVACDRNSSNLR